MVCPHCRARDHVKCPELDRQSGDATPTEKLAGSLCDCQHNGRWASYTVEGARF
jgi:hypothetical protein